MTDPTAADSLDMHDNDNHVASARDYDDRYRRDMDERGGTVVDQQHTFRED